MKFVAACLVYGVHDYAVTLLDAAQRQGRSKRPRTAP